MAIAPSAVWAWFFFVQLVWLGTFWKSNYWEQSEHYNGEKIAQGHPLVELEREGTFQVNLGVVIISFYVTLPHKMKNYFSLQKMSFGIICFLVQLKWMLKRLNSDEDDRTVPLPLKVLFRELSWALADSADKRFHSPAFSFFINLTITEMRKCKRQGRRDPVTSMCKFSLPHSKIATQMIKNIYPGYKGTKRFKTKIRIIVTYALKIDKEHNPHVTCNLSFRPKQTKKMMNGCNQKQINKGRECQTLPRALELKVDDKGQDESVTG